MSQFIIVYLGGGQPNSPEEGKLHMKNYMQWLSALGDKAIAPANPLKNTQVIDGQGVVSTGSKIAMSGYTLIEANNIEEATLIAKDCPFLSLGGTIEVSEVMQMPGMS